MNPEHYERYRQLGLKIGYYRRLRGMTQEQLAEAVDVSAAYIGHLEAPGVDKAPSLDVLFNIADALNIPPHKFLDFDM